MTIEDETGFANLVVFASLFDTFRKEILQSRLLMAEGKLQRTGEVTHVIVKSCYDLSKLLRQLTAAKDNNPSVLTLARADEKTHTIPTFPGQNKRTQVRKTTQEELFPAARNFK